MEGFFKIDNKMVDEFEFGNYLEMAVYMVIARYTNNDQQGFPSLDLIRKKCKCSRTSASRAVKGLEEKGVIYIKRTAGRVNKYKKAKQLPFLPID
ncbi:MAG: helix-turn-helix domain-containing protein [Fusobacteriaceae bacterium]